MMPHNQWFRYLASLSILAFTGPLTLAGRQVAPGLDYEERVLAGPVKVYIARADRTRGHWLIDTMIAKGTAKGARETVPQMADRYQDTVGFRGQHYDVKVAVNGDYFTMSTGVPTGGQIIGGWFVRRYGEYSGGSGLIWTLDGEAVLGANVRNGPKWQRIVFADGTETRIDKLNDPRGRDELALYTWHYADRTDTGEAGVDVVVRMSSPICIMPEGGGVPGEVVAIRKGAGGTSLLYDHVVLSGHGTAGERLLAHARVGEQLRVDLRLQDFGNEGIGLGAADWRGAYASLGAAAYILVDGKVPRHWERKAAEYAKRGETHGSVKRDPRTLLG
ncbi:MAG: hypothetical protein HY718_15250, partial [Planctomycetes bacterium]|nr:hypothetical protein [Planctomycetota bacterium]